MTAMIPKGVLIFLLNNYGSLYVLCYMEASALWALLVSIAFASFLKRSQRRLGRESSIYLFAGDQIKAAVITYSAIFFAIAIYVFWGLGWVLNPSNSRLLSFAFARADPWLISGILSEFGFLTVTLFLAHKGHWELWPKSERRSPSKNYRLLGVGILAVSFSLAIVLVHGLRESTGPSIPHGVVHAGSLVAVVSIISVTLFGPAVEELYFRAGLMQVLSISFSRYSTLFLQAVLFALMHDLSSYTSLLLRFSLGMLFGVLYEATGTVTAPIAAHCCWNLFIIAKSS